MPGAMIVRYEDFLGDPAKSLKKLAQAIDFKADQKDIADAVEFGSLPSLREREREGYFTSRRLRPARKNDKQSGKVRSGTSGGYRDELDAEAAARVDAFVRDNLDPRFGYSAP